MASNEASLLAAFEKGAKELIEKNKGKEQVTFELHNPQPGVIDYGLQHASEAQVDKIINIIDDASDEEEEEDEDDFGNAPVFLKATDFVESEAIVNDCKATTQSQPQTQKAAGIYLPRDEEFEKLKELQQKATPIVQFQGQVSSTQSKTFAMNRQAQERRSKQLRDLKSKGDSTAAAGITKLTKSDFKYDKNNKVKNLINNEEELGEIGEWIEQSAKTSKKAKKKAAKQISAVSQVGVFGIEEEDEDAALSSHGGDSGSEDNEEQSAKHTDGDFDFDDEDFKPPTSMPSQSQVKSNLQKNTQNSHYKEDDLDDDEEKENVFGKLSVLDETKQKKEEAEKIRKAKQEIVQKKLSQQSILQHKSGPIANRLQDKAKFIELTAAHNGADPHVSIQFQQAEPHITNQPLKNDQTAVAAAISGYSKDNEQNDDDGVNWDQINAKAIQEAAGEKKKYGDQQQVINKNGPASSLNFIDAWTDLNSRDLSAFKPLPSSTANSQSTQPPAKQSFFSRLLSSCGLGNNGGSSKLSSSLLIEERDQILAIAKMPFSDNDPLHFEILKSIYCQLRDNNNCPRTGSHWDTIGFQGVNPATDLRGAGILGILQILAFISQHKRFVRIALKHSQDADFGFPLAVTLINVTAVVLETIREGKINGLINEEKSAMSAVNNLYFAGFFKLFTEYQQRKMTFSEIGNVLKSVSLASKLNPKKLIEDFKKDIAKFYLIHGEEHQGR